MEQKWEGYVTELYDDYFSCRLKDLTAGGTDETADIPYNDISKEDLDTIQLGSVFKWTIDDDGSHISFLKPTYYTKEEIDESKEWASKMIKNLKII